MLVQTDATEYDEEDIIGKMQELFNHFKKLHSKYFEAKHEWILFYENCRGFDRAFPNKADTVEIATQHIAWGANAYSKPPAMQQSLKKQWKTYSFDAKDVNLSPKSVRYCWLDYSEKREVKELYFIVKRALKQPRADCDVEVSFIQYSNLMKSTEAYSMGSTTKESRVFAQWIKED